jgi:hypothetical protein
MKEESFCTTEIVIRQKFADGDVNEVTVSSNKFQIDDFKDQLMRASLAIGWSQNQVESIFNEES